MDQAGQPGNGTFYLGGPDQPTREGCAEHTFVYRVLIQFELFIRVQHPHLVAGPVPHGDLSMIPVQVSGRDQSN